MSTSNDIRSLFKQFGGQPEHYQEFTREASGRDASERWPLLSRSASTPATPSAQLPEPAPVLETASLPVPTPAPVLPPDAAQPTPIAQAVTEAADWSAAGLRNLLAKLSETTRPEPTVAASVPAMACRERPDLSHIRVISVMSAKGGVGKTTLTANLASAMRRAGRQVVVIDLDPQNGLHQHFQPADKQVHDQEEIGVAQPSDDWLALGMPSEEGVFILPHGGIDEERRQAFESTLQHAPLWLAHHLADLHLGEGAIVLLDTPPGPSIYLRQALSVANVALAVSLADPASYTSLPQIDKLVAAYTQGREDFTGVCYLINQVDFSRQMNKDITQILQGLLGTRMIGVVHRDQSINEALAFNRNVLGYDPNGRGSHDILLCAQALIGRLATASVE
ncbi:cellulose biosynthesis protein BcsP [Pseudomonas sp.]|uniref:cellulose biosynthesis protein BcsP n=1 Tax=Pseudomonas sp. TaxID=306 RepID=UPI0028A87D8B|nr:cellulose biosynthesis protein BcsP [Pseudomonas sp.]